MRQGLRAASALLVPVAIQQRPDPQDGREPRAQQVVTAAMALLVPLALQEPQEPQEPLDPQVRQALKVLLEVAGQLDQEIHMQQLHPPV